MRARFRGLRERSSPRAPRRLAALCPVPISGSVRTLTPRGQREAVRRGRELSCARAMGTEAPGPPPPSRLLCGPERIGLGGLVSRRPAPKGRQRFASLPPRGRALGIREAARPSPLETLPPPPDTAPPPLAPHGLWAPTGGGAAGRRPWRAGTKCARAVPCLSAGAAPICATALFARPCFALAGRARQAQLRRRARGGRGGRGGAGVRARRGRWQGRGARRDLWLQVCGWMELWNSLNADRKKERGKPR